MWGSLAVGFLVLGLGLSLYGLDLPDQRQSTPRVQGVHLRAVGSENLSGLGRLGFQRLQNLVNRIDDASDSCLRAGSMDRGSAQKSELSQLFRILSNSPTARRLIERAWQNDVYVCSDRHTGLLAYYLSGLRLIGLNSALTEGQKLAFLAHELAHMPQHPVYSDNRFFPPEDLFLLRRVREAAAEACATQIAWELKAGGYPAAWNAKYADRFYGDIARAYAASIDPDAIDDSSLAALRSAFDRWFAATARVNLYDRMTVDHLDRISGDAVGLVAPRRALSHEFLLGIAFLGNHNYLAEIPGPRLTDSYYAGNISAENAGLLEQTLQDAGAHIPKTWGVTGDNPSGFQRRSL